MRILLLSDIHGNYPALKGVVNRMRDHSYDGIINTGDSTVYAPFGNKVLSWLRKNETVTILGNTDIKVRKLLRGKNFTKPSNPEKRIMYTNTADRMKKKNRRYLKSLKKSRLLRLNGWRVGLFHGSPADPNEFLFPSTPDERFQELARSAECDIVITGHSHTPYHKQVGGVHFINPGSTGRMFDGDPRASCALLELNKKDLQVSHFRCEYDIEKVVRELARQNLPEIYARMYRVGRKLN